MLKRLIATTAGALFAAALTLPASAAELLMYRRAGCIWCMAWDRDVGPVYGRTEIGRRAPLRMVDLEQPQRRGPALAAPVRYTPTFVLAENGKEVARIEGYPGESFFWELMAQHILRLHSARQGDLPAATTPVSNTRHP